MHDLISRQAAIDALVGVTMFETKHEIMQRVNASVQDEQGWLGAVAECLDEIEDLPSAQPERKTGHWIKAARWGRVYYCDQCRNYLDFDGVNAGRGSANYCPNCDAKMTEV